jgi:Mce-associated membrane protein
VTDKETDKAAEETVAADEPIVTDTADADGDAVVGDPEDVDAVDDSDVDAGKIEKDLQLSSGRPGKRRGRHGLGARVAVIAIAVALVASAGLATWLYFFQYRPDQQTNADAARVALDAASSGTVALLSYSPESLDKDFTAAKSHLTGDFLSYYTQFTQEIVTPAAKQKQVSTEAKIVQAALSEIKPDSAVALVFVNQTTTSKENPDGAFAASSVKVGMTKIDGSWLISTFDPV